MTNDWNFEETTPKESVLKQNNHIFTFANTLTCGCYNFFNI